MSEQPKRRKTSIRAKCTNPQFDCGFVQNLCGKGCELFENLILNEVIKHRFNRGENPPLYFWQDNHGRKINCLLVNGERVTPVEFKAGKTMSTSYFDNLKYWRDLAGMPDDQGFVVYGGEQSMQTSAGTLISWRNLDRILD